MPGGDRTGPAGLGPMTGWGRGYCSGSGVPGYVYNGFGGGYRGWNRGGRGWRNRFYATGLTGWQRAGFYGPGGGIRWMSPPAPWGSGIVQEEELNSLKEQARYFDQVLKDVRARIDELEAGASPKEA